MAIVNITRIQHRRGNQVDLPTPLASGELGWAIDSQRLFIGNGSLAEGAPAVGNTEVLTEHSDLSALAAGISAFTFEGTPDGSITSGVSRSVKNKLTDTVSVRDFGADGDGSECSGAINAALFDLFTGGSQNQIKLYFPAGEYLINQALEIPPNAYLYGDGMGNTIIKTTISIPLLRTDDSAGDSGGSMGTSAPTPTLPTNITICDMTFQQESVVDDLTELQSTTEMTLERVEFKGIYTSIASTTNNAQIGLSFVSPGAPTASGRITATGCRFRQLGRAFSQGERLYGISFDRCLFDTCYYGVRLYSAPQVLPKVPTIPDPVTISDCYFNSISRDAVRAEDGTKFISTSNTFVDVGNRGTMLSVDNVLYAEDSTGCTSWLDKFERLATDSVKRFGTIVSADANTTQTALYLDPEDRFQFGLKETLRTYKYTVAGGTTENLYEIRAVPVAGAYNDGVVFQEVRYVLRVGSTYTRSGVLQLAIHDTDVDMYESYNYIGSAVTDANFTFSAAMVSGEVTIDCDNAGGTSATLIVSATNLLDE
jgi:hypothetical protein